MAFSQQLPHTGGQWHFVWRGAGSPAVRLPHVWRRLAAANVMEVESASRALVRSLTRGRTEFFLRFACTSADRARAENEGGIERDRFCAHTSMLWSVGCMQSDIVAFLHTTDSHSPFWSHKRADSRWPSALAIASRRSCPSVTASDRVQVIDQTDLIPSPRRMQLPPLALAIPPCSSTTVPVHPICVRSLCATFHRCLPTARFYRDVSTRAFLLCRTRIPSPSLASACFTCACLKWSSTCLEAIPCVWPD